MFCFNRVRGIIFDLDDTLVHANLDFAAIKREISCPGEADILEFVSSLAEGERQAAEQVILDHELKDAECSRLINGAFEFILEAQKSDLPLAIVTRNCRAASNIKINSHKLPIDLVFTREDAAAKPDPDALLQIAKIWQLPVGDLAYIGDYKYDIEAAHNANMQAWLFTYCSKNKHYKESLQFIPKRLIK